MVIAPTGTSHDLMRRFTVPASGLAIGSVSVTHALVTLCAANLAYLWAITVASLANRTYRQLIVPRSTRRCLRQARARTAARCA